MSFFLLVLKLLLKFHRVLWSLCIFSIPYLRRDIPPLLCHISSFTTGLLTRAWKEHCFTVFLPFKIYLSCFSLFAYNRCYHPTIHIIWLSVPSEAQASLRFIIIINFLSQNFFSFHKYFFNHLCSLFRGERELAVLPHRSGCVGQIQF